MKVTLIVFGLACFVGALHAFPLEEEAENDEFGTFLGFEPQVLPNFEENELPQENEIAPSRPTENPPSRQTRPPQIHNNAYKSQGPMSGRLTNIVLNRRGVQKTIQKNKIEFNLNAMKRVLDDLLENEDHA